MGCHSGQTGMSVHFIKKIRRRERWGLEKGMGKAIMTQQLTQG